MFFETTEPKIWPLVQVALVAGKGQVFYLVTTAVLLCNDMLYVKRVGIIIFMEPTVFTTVRRTATDQRTGFVTHYELELSATIRFALALRRVKMFPT